MNILHIISGGEIGGSKNHLLSLASNMKENDMKNIIVCLREGELYNDAQSMGLDIRLISQRWRFDLTIIRELKEICETEDIDIINCHGGRANFIGFFLKISYEAKYVSTIHSDYKDDYRGNSYKTLVFSNINRLVLKRFDNYITVSDNFKEMLIQRGFKEEKIFVVYNGIDFKQDMEEFTRNEVLIRNGIMGCKHYVSMIARFHPVKGHTVFLDACKNVLEKFEDVIFILVGDGDLKDELKLYAENIGIKNNVYFAGFRKPDEFLFISDFTVLASYTESFPLVILESAFYEKTVISTEVGGINKLIKNEENGYLVMPGDSEGMGDRMLELLKDSEKSYCLGQKLFEDASANYSIESMTENYTKIYQKIDGGIYI